MVYVFQFPLLDASISITLANLHALGALAIPIATEGTAVYHCIDATSANRHIRTLQHHSKFSFADRAGFEPCLLPTTTLSDALPNELPIQGVPSGK